ncbi:MAG TPA: SDR family oxidoreductase, partial [Noviherbaspirillum sp.]
MIAGIANENSIAYGCAKAFHELGTTLAITYANEKTRTYVEPLACGLETSIFMPLDVTKQSDLDAV